MWCWLGRIRSWFGPGQRCYVTRVVDGDGFYARLPWGVESCRIRGMDAPELATVGLAKWLRLPAWRARRSKRLLARFCARRYVDITWETGSRGPVRDKYGRVLVHVHRNGRDVVPYMTRRLAAVRWPSVRRRSPLKGRSWQRWVIGR